MEAATRKPLMTTQAQTGVINGRNLTLKEQTEQWDADLKAFDQEWDNLFLDMFTSDTLVTGNTGTVTFWEAWHATMPAKRCTYHAMPSGRHSAQTVTMPPIFGQNPGNSKTDVCYLPSTHAMTNFPLSCSRLKKSLHSPLPLQQTHCGWTRLAAHHGSSLLFSQKPNGCFRQ
jgi:hypothetical protein